MKFDNKKILITGGSSGIGKALITSFYQRGARQFAVLGRDEEKMQTLRHTFPDADFIFLVVNLTDPKGLKTVIDHLAGQWDKKRAKPKNARGEDAPI